MEYLKGMDQQTMDKLSKVSKEIVEIIQKNELMVSQACGIFGSIFALMCSQTEENFPFISFLNSFTRSYHANYQGSEIHQLSEAFNLKDLK